MNRLTQKDKQGNWGLKGVRWYDLCPGGTITKEMYEKLYAALWKLMEYEDTDLSPEEIREMDKLYTEKCRELAEEKQKHRWIPVEERLPEDDRYILLSLENFDLPIGGRYDTDTDGGRAFYLGDCDEGDTCIANDLYVNAWMPLPDPYRPEKLKEADSAAADHADQDTIPELAKEHLMQRFMKIM